LKLGKKKGEKWNPTLQQKRGFKDCTQGPVLNTGFHRESGLEKNEGKGRKFRHRMGSWRNEVRGVPPLERPLEKARVEKPGWGFSERLKKVPEGKWG